MLSREVAGPADQREHPAHEDHRPWLCRDMVQSAGDYRRVAAARIFRVALPPEESGLFLWGVVCASCLWFLSLTTISSLFKNRFTPRLLRIINLVAA